MLLNLFSQNQRLVEVGKDLWRPSDPPPLAQTEPPTVGCPGPCLGGLRKIRKISRDPTAPPRLVWSVNLLWMHSTPASRSKQLKLILLIKMLNRIGPRIEPWGMLLVTIHQPDVAPFTFWAPWLSQFIILCSMSLFIVRALQTERLCPPHSLHPLSGWSSQRKRSNY